MWLWLSLTALLCWSGSDLFSKIGCRDGSDRYSHLKMVIAVGVVMGLHAAFEIFVGGTAISWSVIWTYLPVSLLYAVVYAVCAAVNADLGYVVSGCQYSQKTYGSETVLQLFQSCTPEVKPIALAVLKDLAALQKDKDKE